MKIKPYLQVYRRSNSRDLFFGVGPDKKVLACATETEVEFVRTIAQRQESNLQPQERQWLESLEQNGLIEETDVLQNPSFADIAKYDRQLNYFRLFVPDSSAIEAQRRLRASRVVVIGLGAGGTTLCRFLSAAGIGTIEGVDDDTICEQNLPTHTALGVGAVGKTKTQAVSEMMELEFPDTKFVPIVRRVQTVEDVRSLIRGADFFCTTFDRPRSVAAHIANAAGLAEAVPFGSIGATDKGARVGPIVIAGSSPCYECFHIDEPEFIVASERAALMGATVTFLASVFTHEIVRVITGYTPSVLVGRLLYTNTATWQQRIHNPNRPKDWICQCCGWSNVA